MRKPRFAPVRFRFWGLPHISKRVEVGGWVRHNLVVTAKVCWKVVDVLVGGVFIPVKNNSVTPQDVIGGKPVLARVLESQPVEGVTLARIEALAKADQAKYDVIVAPVRAFVIGDGSKCVQKLRLTEPPSTKGPNIVILNPNPKIRVVVATVPTGTPAVMRFDYQLKHVVISREEAPI